MGEMENGFSRSLRNRLGAAFFLVALASLGAAIAIVLLFESASPANPEDPAQVARGKQIYEQHCGSCHGAKLEGQPDWRDKLPTGRMPAPPHDASGHTWHHPDSVLFGITRDGVVPGRYAPPGYQSDMPAYAGTLSDGDIWAVLAYIKWSWPTEIRSAQRDLTAQRDRR